MSDYSEFFLNSLSSVVQLELLEIYHPNFSKTYRLVRNAVEGVTVTLEDLTEETFEYYPLKITPDSPRDNLDFSIDVQMGDLGEVLPKELDNVAAVDAFNIKPTVRYWIYRSDDLSAPLIGPFNLEVSALSFNRDGCSFSASAPNVNLKSTGEIYELARFPMLSGVL